MHRTAWLAVAAGNALIAVLAEVLAGLVLPGLGMSEAAQLVAAGARFQIVHALALMALSALAWPRENVAWLFLYGTLFFSGSVYMRALGLPAPILGLAALGALLALIGWVKLALGALMRPST
jgi:uncharacterized membrane protein YgdD (TMEM256/DUF423 family)